MERSRSSIEFIRASLPEDNFLFRKLIDEAQIGESVQVLYFREDPNNPEDQVWSEIRAWDKDHYVKYLEAVRSFLRAKALEKCGSLPVWPGTRKPEGYFLSDHIIVCHDATDQKIYEGKIEECSFEAQKLLAVGEREDDWGKVIFWDLGTMEDLMKHKTLTGALCLREPGVFLFSDELSELETGNFVAVQKHQFCPGYDRITFEGYQQMAGRIYRIWAQYID